MHLPGIAARFISKFPLLYKLSKIRYGKVALPLPYYPQIIPKTFENITMITRAMG